MFMETLAKLNSVYCNKHVVLCVYFWSSGIMECMMFTFENRVPLLR